MCASSHSDSHSAAASPVVATDLLVVLHDPNVHSLIVLAPSSPHVSSVQAHGTSAAYLTTAPPAIVHLVPQHTCVCMRVLGVNVYRESVGCTLARVSA